MQMRSHPHLEFDALMRHLMLVGSIGLAAGTVAGALGAVSGYVALTPTSSVRLLLALGVLVCARRIYWQVTEWRLRRLPPDVRYGFTNALRGRSRSDEFIAIIEGDVEVEATTGSSHAQG